MKKFGEEQGGFRPNRSTTDHVFVLSEVMRARKARGLDAHIAFLDIRKAYDTVSHECLWKRLLDIGVNGKMWRVIRNIYEIVESTVIVGEELTEWFALNLGVKQGCTLSPFLFLIFVEGLSQQLRKSKVGLQAGHSIINHLLFADDLALCASSREELQTLLDIVYNYSCRWRFKFNVAKCNVVFIAGKKAHVLQGKCYLGLDVLKVVKAYPSLGLEFEDNLEWNLAKQRLLTKAQGKLALLRKAKSEGLSLPAAENVWWAMVVPALYLAASFDQAEKLKLKAGRILLGVSRFTANAVVRGELGWWTMQSLRDLKMLIFWARLVRMDNSRLAKIVYKQR